MAFNWARMAAGQKVTNSQLEAESKAKTEAEDKFLDEQRRVQREKNEAAYLRQKLAAQEKAYEYEMQKQAYEIARIAEKAREEKRALALTREKGYWCNHTYRVQYADHSEYLVPGAREFPKGCNERALKWVQEWFTVWGDKLKEVTTLAELKQLYYEHWCPWLISKYSRTSHEVERYIERHNPSTDTGIPPATQYKLVQEWVKSMEKPGNRPWDDYCVWTPAKHITWENVLYIMTKSSGAFKDGLIEITGTQITWIVELSPYKTIKFKDKPLTKAQAQAKKQRDHDDMW
jgi:hypothetical protein